MLVSDLILLQAKHHGPHRLERNLGDGYLYAKNPTFRRVRNATLGAGFRFTLGEPRSYFAFPLISLDTLLESRTVPYRDNLVALEQLERARPGFFTLTDLHKNRPIPNYVLHESAHALGFDTLFGRTVDVGAELARPDRLVHGMLCEAFAMTSEYLAACATTDPIHVWLFSISSYRHRTQAKKAVGELLTEHGFERITWALLSAFLYTNFLVPKLEKKHLERILALCPLDGGFSLNAKDNQKLRRALNALMPMNPEFVVDTARLFLTMHGYPRDLKRVLRVDPIDLVAKDPRLGPRIAKLIRTVADD